MADGLIDEALSTGQLEAAKQLADVLSESAKSRDNSLRKQATSRIRQVEELRQLRAEMEEALAVLKKNPADPAANQTVGEYRSFVKGNWKEGLPHLVRGSDASVKTAAQRDLAMPSQPERQIEVGDSWWGAGRRAGRTGRAEPPRPGRLLGIVRPGRR